jgi:hypothetical protein
MQFEDSVAAVSDYATYLSGFQPLSQSWSPIIEQWSVVGHDRIVGTVHNRPGASDGRTIITSPVLQVRLMGEPRIPVAFTESGSAYRLGTPSASFGIDQAEHFVWFKSREPAGKPSQGGQDTSLRTAMMKLAA